MRRVGFALSVMFAAAVSWPASAEPPVLTLAEALEIALRDSHRIGAATAALGEADAGFREARARRLPTVDLTETVVRSTNPVLVFGNLLGQEAFGPLDLSTINEPDALTNYHTRLSVSQPVWTGGRIRNAVETASMSRAAAADEGERVRQEVVHQVIDAYSGAVLSSARLEVAREARATARAHVDLVSDLRDAGLVVQSDLLQARVRESELEEMVIRGESDVAVAHAAVNLALGRDLDTPFSLPAEIEEPSGLEDEDLEALVREALENRPDLRAADSRLGAARRSVRLERAGYLPEVGLVGAFEANDADFVGADGTNWSVMLAAKFTAFDGLGTRARVRGAEERARRARRMTDLARQTAELEVRRAFHDLRASRQRLDQSRRAAELARESLRIVEDRYREGLTTLVELLDAETALTRARTREVAARRDLLVGRATLDLALGRARLP